MDEENNAKTPESLDRERKARGDFELIDPDAARGGEMPEARRGTESAPRQLPVQTDAAQRSFIESDVFDFLRRFPQFGVRELAELENNAQFRRFCGTRFGREPLADLYGDYLAIVGEAGRAALSRSARKTERSTGGGASGADVLTPEQRKVLDEWNAEHPEMAMTAKEFLRR
ncbi:MAG: hypothetical protein IJU66_06585 [Oscillospiraceae bacterium]|nr:hypothetical protein [Oscillospiraceae bacterium]